MYFEYLFVTLLAFQVVHMLFHDWLDLHPLNDLRGMSRSMPLRTRVLMIVGNTLPAAVALALALTYFGRRTPVGVGIYWTFYYSVTLVMMYFAWYQPYLFGATPEQGREYDLQYASTLQLLPARGANPRPNAAHVVLHMSFAICWVLAILISFNFV